MPVEQMQINNGHPNSISIKCFTCPLTGILILSPFHLFLFSFFIYHGWVLGVQVPSILTEQAYREIQAHLLSELHSPWSSQS